MSRSPDEIAERIRLLDRISPDWREMRYPTGERKYADDGTMLNENGTRSIFDDVDC